MRGAWKAYDEYIPELHTEFGFPIVGCDVVAHVTRAGVLSDTRRGRQHELLVNKGGNTVVDTLVLFRTGFFYFIRKLCSL